MSQGRSVVIMDNTRLTTAPKHPAPAHDEHEDDEEEHV
jgi:hypothetical protein